MIHAVEEKINVNWVILASNIFATNILINCESINPNASPTIKDIVPISNVSQNSIIDIFLLLIPSVKYTPNSLFLLLIRNLEAYIIKNPNINDTKTLTPESILVINLIISLVEAVTSIITVCESIALNT